MCIQRKRECKRKASYISFFSKSYHVGNLETPVMRRLQAAQHEETEDHI